MSRIIPLLFAALLAPPLAAADKPNVVLILADDLGFSDLGCYGGEISTPNLDALAADGLKFTQFYNTGRCWPTRAASLTGYYAQSVRRDKVANVPSGVGGTRPTWGQLLPDLLKPLGYHSYHSGKWHIDGLPLENGFEHSYSLNDHDRHFYPKKHTEDDKPLPPVDKTAGYYSSSKIASHAIECIEGHVKNRADTPFFSFVAFTAPHFPVQAPAADIAKYKTRYLAGWDALRTERFERQKSLHLGGNLSQVERKVGPPYAFPKAIEALGPNEVNRPLEWASLSAEQREFQACKMAVHAAMVDRMDQEIGRVIATLKKANKFDNTLVIFLSDNGASAEMMVRGDGHDQHAECGTGATFLSIGPGWSSLCNTPFRRHKTWVHEGGTHTPFIAHWPHGIAAKGELRTTPTHVIDLVPTIVQMAGGKLAGPARPGMSLLPVFAHDNAARPGFIWWLHENNRALRQGNWKIVASGKESQWELYDLAADPTETTNLALTKPEKVRELATLWDAEDAKTAARAQAR